MISRENDIVVRSWSELCERLYDGSWQADLGRFRSNYAFRGVSETDYDLTTSLRRLCGRSHELEYHLLRNFRKYAQVDAAEQGASDWHWLTLAQHHGLPTRLLDWTYSPFVAAHFATANTERFDRDGAIWRVDYVRTNRLAPPVLRAELDEVGANAFTVDMLERAVPDLRSFDKLATEDFTVFFEPPSLDARIVNQFAFFSVMSSATAFLHAWLSTRPLLYGRIIIPAELKWEVRDKLDQANITERILFPGLDGLASWLTRHYTPRGPLNDLNGVRP